MFLLVMAVGLAGLLLMALPALGRHGGAAGHLGRLGRVGHAAGRLNRVGHAAARLNRVGHAGRLAGAKAGAQAGHALPPHAGGPAGRALVGQASAHGAVEAPAGLTRYLPSPRLIFSLLALYGAFANALEWAAHLSPLVAALVAILPAAAVERFLVTPLWNFLFRFQGEPSSPLEELVLSEARAVTAFKNGRGIVSLVRDGRTVQFSARLLDERAGDAVRVGDVLRVEDVDARHERVTVSLEKK